MNKMLLTAYTAYCSLLALIYMVAYPICKETFMGIAGLTIGVVGLALVGAGFAAFVARVWSKR